MQKQCLVEITIENMLNEIYTNYYLTKLAESLHDNDNRNKSNGCNIAQCWYNFLC